MCDSFRFLRMRDFDTAAAKDMFLKFIKWREDFRTDTISKVIHFQFPFQLIINIVVTFSYFNIYISGILII